MSKINTASCSKIIFLFNQQVNRAEQLERLHFTESTEALVIFQQAMFLLLFTVFIKEQNLSQLIRKYQKFLPQS